ncbi:sigma-70 family RNA polymerase sigma factor [Pyxidicoccus xibeiensis]|uniref:sigma-70 family RNA polymerase sigma factor n=1 Tax=Pyxidicoccus xibeiensis TaxID=2906759 RepID=UPI0020A80B2B|nr:sigma-70 family RNA polymerase sigma factor [Pyxidicoccus xibeiensis]MCP3138188.1 sigma-70 family RNA polymerase sigma factor [Pyxidicoccus xibeiensis]
MEPVRGLAEMFLATAKVRFAPPPSLAALEALLSRSWEEARAHWPTVVLPPPLFVAHVAERLPEEGPDSPPEALMGQLSLVDLYLACACVHGIPSAIETFDRHYLAKLPALLRRSGQSAALIDDLCQQARLNLLVPTPGGEARIASYSGRGALTNWVSVAVSRMKLKMLDKQGPAPDGDGDNIEDWGIPSPEQNLEVEFIRRRHHADFRLAIKEAFSTLPDDKRHLLRLYYGDQLSSYELAPLFNVNQGTISRWLKAAREAVYAETRRLLQERLGLSTQDIESIGGDSQLGVSLSQLLGRQDGTPSQD